ncbi:N-acetyltransferase [Arthrobacter sp. BL-252-APC-1A]|uniref:GNAT family N-acetyltransferase n=1 Tax=Arthrobacter sp. BL-252-APC-1A TaxID=2606622 RepID=UPI0012B26047|nr:GNAT family N-acetyltransferase [Arthrobacter sp. BL-252-APC-1A]MSS00191.1 N-acetyltransferase [Arthrobacter sp. BL-252-APC-1A]
MKIQHNPAKQRYEAIDEGDGTVAGFAAYRDRPGSRAFTHTEVSDAYAGQGVASELARFAVEDVRDADRRLVPYCPYIARWLTRHPEYTGFVDWPQTAKTKNGESAR